MRFRTLASYRESCKDRLDCTDAQADLGLHWAHMQSCRKCSALDHISFCLPHTEAVTSVHYFFIDMQLYLHTIFLDGYIKQS